VNTATTDEVERMKSTELEAELLYCDAMERRDFLRHETRRMNGRMRPMRLPSTSQRATTFTSIAAEREQLSGTVGDVPAVLTIIHFNDAVEVRRHRVRRRGFN
jgi:hypothetical protein